MKGTLILTLLKVKSSYLRELEEPLSDAGDVPDTLQWWLSSELAWRIKTFALDRDIHTYSIGSPGPTWVQVARENDQKHYGDVISLTRVLEFEDCTDVEEVTRVFRSAGLEPRLEVAAGRFAFWKPDEGRYWTQSQPKA